MRTISLILLCALNGAMANPLITNDGNGNYSYDGTNTNLNQILGQEDKDNGWTFPENIKSLTINTPESILEGIGFVKTYKYNDPNKQDETRGFEIGGEGNEGYSFNITAQQVTIEASELKNKDEQYYAKIMTFSPSSINADFNITNTSLQIANTNGQNMQDYSYNGSLYVDKNFTATGSDIMKNVTTNAELQTFIVKGKSTITDTTFTLASTDTTNSSMTRALLITSNGGFNTDISTINKAKFMIIRDTAMLESAYDFTFTHGSEYAGSADGTYDEAFTTELEQKGNNLYAVRKIGNASLKDLQTKLLEMDLKVVERWKSYAEKERDNKQQRPDRKQGFIDQIADLDKLKPIIEAKQNEIANKTDAQITEEYNQKSGSQYGSVAYSALTANDKNSVGTMMASDLLFNNGEGAVKETIDSTTQIADDGGQSQTSTAQNMQSEMATTTRMARFSNPYTKTYYAQNTMTTQKALNGEIRSDVPLTPYYKTPTSALPNNFWANVFGGANIIGENVGSIYGLNTGYDRQIGAHFIGAYLSYAYANMKDTHIKQIAHNIQAGLYSRLVFGKNEIDLKLSAQAGVTNQNRFVANLSNDADFVRAFMSANAAYGYVFKMGQGVFLKPLVGLNLYFSHTPKYSEKGDSALETKAMNSVNLSVDLGADLRAYWNENSFFYFTPKFEQYVLTQNDDFVGAFVGSPNNFRLKSNNKLKTYFQGIIGVDLGVYEGLAITLSAGVKQILAGQVEDKNETYISGNLGVKYRF